VVDAGRMRHSWNRKRPWYCRVCGRTYKIRTWRQCRPLWRQLPLDQTLWLAPTASSYTAGSTVMGVEVRPWWTE
jgi:hypothetical protein